jgi:hypothetical protein
MNDAKVRVHLNLHTADKKNKNPRLSGHIQIDDRRKSGEVKKKVKKEKYREKKKEDGK